MQHKDLGLPKNTTPEKLKKELKENNIQPDAFDHQGNFYWYFGVHNDHVNGKDVYGESAREYKKELPHTKARKFQLMAEMGLLDDNGILSNKVKNTYGKRPFHDFT